MNTHRHGWGEVWRCVQSEWPYLTPALSLPLRGPEREKIVEAE